MPVVYLGKDKFIMRWNPEHDIEILVIAHNYRTPKGFIRWKKALADGYLKDLPENVTTKDLSRRVNYLLNIRFNQSYKKIKLKKAKEYAIKHPEVSFKSYTRKKLLVQGLSKELKEKYKIVEKRKWTDKQIKKLIFLAEKYRVSEKKINWKKLIKDKEIKKLPNQDLTRLRSYYWRIITLSQNPKALENKRKSSLKWKKENRKRYNQNNLNYKKGIKIAANEYLHDIRK